MGNNTCCAQRQQQIRMADEETTDSVPSLRKNTRRPIDKIEDSCSIASKSNYSNILSPKRPKRKQDTSSRTLNIPSSNRNLRKFKKGKSGKRMKNINGTSSKNICTSKSKTSDYGGNNKSSKNASELYIDNEMTKMYAEKRARRVSFMKGIEYKPIAYSETPITKEETIGEYRDKLRGVNFDNFTKYNKKMRLTPNF
ncbi:unnamed protein product [Moneuplotes crassus]|uniref:Uncharacterized protein n=1 Tax=Euplotes crassus TaxID=5936 RepID=A0AAD1XEG5_EUPCR|nr:unnamed protein product [Moneuplotes crassus]